MQGFCSKAVQTWLETMRASRIPAGEGESSSGYPADRGARSLEPPLQPETAITQIPKCEDDTMKKAFALVLLLLILVFSTQVFSQSSNASLSGTVADVSGGVIPNVTVTATNTATGVVSNSCQ